MASAVATGALSLHGGIDRPLASIDDVVKLGNTGGGDLGNVLRIFASGNHALMPGQSNQLDTPVPTGFFSLDFPGSQGSHPGHSGILQGNPSVLNSGRFSPADFERLTSRARNGYLKRSDIGKFIAENLKNDPESKVLDSNVVKLLLGDTFGVVARTGPAIVERLRRGEVSGEEHRKLFVALTKLLGENNLVGSAGEFGLLMALLAHSPHTRVIDNEPAIRVEDVRAMFVDHRFPDKWEAWPKRTIDWVANTLALFWDATQAYARPE